MASSELVAQSDLPQLPKDSPEPLSHLRELPSDLPKALNDLSEPLTELSEPPSDPLKLQLTYLRPHMTSCKPQVTS